MGIKSAKSPGTLFKPAGSHRTFRAIARKFKLVKQALSRQIVCSLPSKKSYKKFQLFETDKRTVRSLICLNKQMTKNIKGIPNYDNSNRYDPYKNR